MEKSTPGNSLKSIPRKRISWRPLIAGIITVLSAVLVLKLIWIGFGPETYDQGTDRNLLYAINKGSLNWWTLINFIALFAGGLIAGMVGISILIKIRISRGK